VDKMKLTRILPRILAIEWQRYDLNHVDSQLEFHKAMAKGLQKMSDEGHEELERLQGGKN